jgi:hypothetical protein
MISIKRRKNILFSEKRFFNKGIVFSISVSLGFGLLLLNSCITPFEPKIDKYDNVLVVDAVLTNLHGSCIVKLSRTYPYNSKHYLIETDANVKITDDLGNETILSDKNNGVYLPGDTNFVGAIGRKYKVTVNTTSGESCESGFEELKEPVEIENVYYKYAELGNGFNGLQIYVDTSDPQKKSFFYSWNYDETWEFWVPYVSSSVFLPEMKICYKHVTSRRFLIESTKDYVDDRVIAFPLCFVGNNTNRLSVKYSLLVTQFILTENTYRFYKNLKDINENTGTLFDRIPVILVGNITNISHPGQPILGNFQVSGASEKRIFILNSELPSKLIIPTEYEFCTTDVVSKKRDPNRLDSLLAEGWAPMDTIIEPSDQDTIIGLAIRRGCFDCKTAGKIDMPPFWNGK